MGSFGDLIGHHVNKFLPNHGYAFDMNEFKNSPHYPEFSNAVHNLATHNSDNQVSTGGNLLEDRENQLVSVYDHPNHHNGGTIPVGGSLMVGGSSYVGGEIGRSKNLNKVVQDLYGSSTPQQLYHDVLELNPREFEMTREIGHQMLGAHPSEMWPFRIGKQQLEAPIQNYYDYVKSPNSHSVARLIEAEHAGNNGEFWKSVKHILGHANKVYNTGARGLKYINQNKDLINTVLSSHPKTLGHFNRALGAANKVHDVSIPIVKHINSTATNASNAANMPDAIHAIHHGIKEALKEIRPDVHAEVHTNEGGAFLKDAGRILAKGLQYGKQGIQWGIKNYPQIKQMYNDVAPIIKDAFSKSQEVPATAVV